MITKYNKLFIISTIFFLAMILISCGSQTKDESSGQEEVDDSNTEESSSDEQRSKDENPVVTITMEDDEQVRIELYPDIAPNTVNNFISLIEDGFYDGLIFHRVIPDFMIQGGDPDGNGTGGPGYSIKGEFDSNGFDNDLKHTRGVISMARSQSPDSAGSQFFIMVNDSPNLDGDYAGFGEVTDGMDTVDKIVETERDNNDKPLEDQTMKKVEVDTKSFDYDEPEVE